MSVETPNPRPVYDVCPTCEETPVADPDRPCEECLKTFHGERGEIDLTTLALGAATLAGIGAFVALLQGNTLVALGLACAAGVPLAATALLAHATEPLVERPEVME